MNAVLAEWAAKIEAMSRRERLMLIVGALVAIYFVWDAALLTPLLDEREKLGLERVRLEQELAAMGTQTATLAAALEKDPHAGKRREQQALQAELNALERRIEDGAGEFIEPAQMVRVLRDLLSQRSALRLVRFEALPPKPVLNEEFLTAPSGDDLQIFKHAFVIEFDGSYFDAVSYLKEVQALPWNLFWGGLSYEVVEYPRARVTLRIHTLNRQEGSIGV